MNIPKTNLDFSKNILLVGLGGGFDVLTGLPFVYHWRDKNFVLANYGNTDSFHVLESTEANYPEGLISDCANIVKKYTIGRHGFGIVKHCYKKIVEENNIDCVLAIDGGVDSLATGDEQDSGTILEDFISLAALSEIKVDKVLCCAGFGTETEENMNHYRILENMSFLSDGFLGSFSLTKNMLEFKEYQKECESIWGDVRRKSHIQTKIISAVNGGFGSFNQYKDIDPMLSVSTGITFVSLLSSIYWMFDFDAVVLRNKALGAIKKGNTFVDCKILLREFLKSQSLRSHENLPL